MRINLFKNFTTQPESDNTASFPSQYSSTTYNLNSITSSETFNLKPKTSQGGQLIVEAVIAIFIITVSILVFVALLARATALNRVINDRYTAVYLAAEGIEVVKNIIDGNSMHPGTPWNAGVSTNGDYEVAFDSKNLQIFQNLPLKFDKTTGIYDLPNIHNGANPNSPFQRKITICAVNSAGCANISGGEIRVNSIVKWRTGGVNYEVNLEDHFFDWRN